MDAGLRTMMLPHVRPLHVRLTVAELDLVWSCIELAYQHGKCDATREARNDFETTLGTGCNADSVAQWRDFDARR